MKTWMHLPYFLAVIRRGSMEAAAKELGVNRTTVARHIAALEAELGEKALQRESDGYHPTEVGAEVLAIAQEVEDRVVTIERRISGKDQSLQGEIRVSAPQAMAAGHLSPILLDFAKEYPDIILNVQGTNDLINLNRGEGDVVLRVTQQPPLSWVGRKLADFRWALYGADCKYTRADAATEDNPITEPTSVITGINDDSIVSALAPYLAQPIVAARCDDIMTIREMTASGFGVAKMPCAMGEPDPRLVRLSPPFEDDGWDLWILTHEDTYASARVKVFMRFVGDRMRAHRHMYSGEDGAEGGSIHKTAKETVS